MRGGQPDTNKSGSEFRLLLLGDSFIQADEIEYSGTMGALLENDIGNENFRVFQQGMASWSPLLEFNWLIKRYSAIEPDAVIVFLCVNDFFNERSQYGDIFYEKKTVFDSSGMPQYFDIDVQHSQKRSGYFYSLTLPKIRTLIRGALALMADRKNRPEMIGQDEIGLLLSVDQENLENELDRIVGDWKYSEYVKEMIRLARNHETWDSYTEKNVDISLKYLLKMNEFLKIRNSGLLITFAPFGWAISPDETIPGKGAYRFGNDVLLPSDGLENRIKNFCIDEEISYIDLTGDLRNYRMNNNEPLYFEYDGHWNPHAHKFIAQKIGEFLSAHSWLP